MGGEHGRGGSGGSGSGIVGIGASAPPHHRRRRRHPLLPTTLLPLLFFLLAAAPRPCDAGIHVSHVIQDGRALIPLSPNFGFDPRGGGGVVATIRAPLVVYRPHNSGDVLVPPDRESFFSACFAWGRRVQQDRRRRENNNQKPEAAARPPSRSPPLPRPNPKPPKQTTVDNFGLILVPVGEQREMHERVARGECPLAALAGPAGPDDAAAAQRALYLPVLSFADAGVQAVADNRADNYTLHVEMATGGGWYGLWFASCEPHTPVTFSVRAELFNPSRGGEGGQGGGDGGAFGPAAAGGRNYLSVGYRELDEVYVAFSAAYAAAAAIWLAILCRARFFSSGGGAVARARAGAAAQAAAAGASPDEVAAAARGAPVVRPLHWLMAALVLVKAATLVCQAVSVRVVEHTGRAEGGWERARLAFYVLRGLFLFCVLVLLASGWSLLLQQQQQSASPSSSESASSASSILDPSTQRVLMAVLPLQAFANVALAVAAEDDSPSAPGRLTWLHVFRAADLLCCLAVLVPVVLTAAKLRREAEAGDGKARRALDRLVAFRRFYVVFVAWVWTTRVLSVLLEGALPLTLAWVAPTVEEGATLLFYAFVGASFRPRAVGESYAHLTDEELAEIEL
jgi:hypothetical protein